VVVVLVVEEMQIEKNNIEKEMLAVWKTGH
jgi:hypothetical protein